MWLNVYLPGEWSYMQLAQTNLPIAYQKQKLKELEKICWVGDLVLLQLPNQKCKLQAKWQGPSMQGNEKDGTCSLHDKNIWSTIYFLLQKNYCKNNPIPCFISTNEIGNAAASLSLLMLGQAKEDGIIEKEAYALRWAEESFKLYWWGWEFTVDHTLLMLERMKDSVC